MTKGVGYEKRRTKTNKRVPVSRVSGQAVRLRGGAAEPQLRRYEDRKLSYNIICHAELVSASHINLRNQSVGVETPTYSSCNDVNSIRLAGLDPTSNNQANRSRVKHGMTILSPGERVRERGRKFGFTLAEVLITLGIIGIVAALTMPSMIANYQKKQTVVGLKKAYNVMSNAFRNAEMEYGPIETWDDVWSETYLNNPVAFVDKYLKPSLKNYEYRLRKGQISTVYGNNNKWFYLDDGTCFSLYVVGSSYSSFIFYDVNGNAKPNVVGKDIFVFTFNYQHYYKFTPFVSTWYRNGGAKFPISKGIRDWLLVQNTQGGCNKDSNNFSCASVIMYDGWQISFDYPW